MNLDALRSSARTLVDALSNQTTRRGLVRLSGIVAAGSLARVLDVSTADARRKKKRKKKRAGKGAQSPPPLLINPCAGQADGAACGAGAICLSGVCVCPAVSNICGGQCLPSCGTGQRRDPSNCQCIACIIEDALADTCESNQDCCSDRCAPLTAGDVSICRLAECRAAGAECRSSFQCCTGSCRVVGGTPICDSGI